MWTHSSSTIHVRLLLTRHGESEWNAKGLIQGRQDTRLSDEGRAQAKQLGNHLKGRHVKKIYASPLSRAKETAEIVKSVLEDNPGMVIPIILDDRLAERGFGSLEGKKLTELSPSELEFIKRLDTTIPGVEPLGIFRDRVFDFYRQLQRDDVPVSGDEDCALIVSHVGQLRVVFVDMLGVTLPAKPRNCAVYEIDATPDAFHVVKLNEAGFLGEEKEKEYRRIHLF